MDPLQVDAPPPCHPAHLVAALSGAPGFPDPLPEETARALRDLVNRIPRDRQGELGGA